ncbi:MAG: glycosyl transferase family 28 [Verrucomicrobiaceae bacterium]|nr:glycosyl transferase family 28 [Verrucomicrobiaceae bacterium]
MPQPWHSKAMAHFLLCPFGSGGDVFPFIGIGRELRARGHRVTLVSMDTFEDAIRAAGLGYASMGSKEEFDRFSQNPDLWKPIKGTLLVFKMAGEALRHYFDKLKSLIQPGEPTLIMAAGTVFGARLIREKLGVPLIVVHLQPAVFVSVYDTPVFLEGMDVMNKLPRWLKRLLLALPNPMDLGAGPAIRRACKEEGVPPPRHVHPDWWHSPDGNVALFPEWFAGRQPDWPQPLYQHTFPMEDLAREATLSPELERFLEADDKPLVFTPGTANQNGREFFAAALDACQRLGRRAIFATRHQPDLPPALPPTIIGVEYVPFSLLLPRAAALVYHGGIGTCSQALAAGIPHLIMAMAHDQPDNANRLRRLGVGDSLHPKQWTGDRIEAKLRRLLDDPNVASQCQHCADLMREAPGLDKLAEWLETQPRTTPLVSSPKIGNSSAVTA